MSIKVPHNLQSCLPLAGELTLSVVSHGHGVMITNLLKQLDEMPALEGVRIVLTLNQISEEVYFAPGFPRRLQITIIRNSSPLGFGANHNQAFKYCDTRWFAILNPDLSIKKDVFATLIAKADHQGASLAVPLVVNGGGVEEDSVRKNLTPWSLIKRKAGFSKNEIFDEKQFRWFAGMFYLVRSDAFRRLRGFDERYFMYCEDYDFFARFWLEGFKYIFERDVQVIHEAQRASRKSGRHFLMHFKSMLRVWFSLAFWRVCLSN